MRYRSENPCQLGAVHTCDIVQKTLANSEPSTHAISFRKPLPTRSRPHMTGTRSRGEHYGQRPFEDAASTGRTHGSSDQPVRYRSENPCQLGAVHTCDIVQKTIANSEPSTHAISFRKPLPTRSRPHMRYRSENPCQLGAVHTCDIVQKTLANSEPSTHAISFRKPLPTRSRPHMRYRSENPCQLGAVHTCDIVQKTLANSEPSTHGTPVPSISASCGAESHRLFLVAQLDCPASRELRVLVAANCVELFLSETGKGAKVRPGELKPRAELD